ncbi:hypothetical protein A2572_00740 [Candidatus Collierbacteria bacterium RIFOXYD1_FULL_40_9]|uniref:RNase H type-1 domain-containing protein n=1 Tax=Candidatus Collierbacteria bacterium RIFOXYD1_FULL_40_9 TaxID=1817731 RepID=A0A1F5FW14_9BACT|nr:MAG: hypothetical protein A2572_00740 [Candidatus Collierbacteria bacterium RIFOXYD1_FULL_40_9]
MSDFSEITINTDGGSRGNPGPSAIGVILKSGNQKIGEISEYLGITTNNVAEYTAVIKALDYLVQNKIMADHLLFVLDSELVVKQINGLYKVKLPHLRELNQKIKNQISNLILQKQIQKVTFVNVLREKNKEADALVNSCLDSQK